MHPVKSHHVRFDRQPGGCGWYLGFRNDAAAPSPLDARLAWIASRAQQKFGIAAVRQSGYRKQERQRRQDRQSLINCSSLVVV